VTEAVVLRADRWIDVDAGEVRSPGLIVVEGERIVSTDSAGAPPGARVGRPWSISAGVKIACGTDAPAVPHGDNAKELVALVDRGLTPMQALGAATVTSAELIERDHELGRLAPGYLADIIAVPGNPAEDITVTQDVQFVMKGGRIFP
jgi:imidazolonepropionase-like amidohydrolase